MWCNPSINTIVINEAPRHTHMCAYLTLLLKCSQRYWHDLYAIRLSLFVYKHNTFLPNYQSEISNNLNTHVAVCVFVSSNHIIAIYVCVRCTCIPKVIQDCTDNPQDSVNNTTQEQQQRSLWGGTRHNTKKTNETLNGERNRKEKEQNECEQATYISRRRSPITTIIMMPMPIHMYKCKVTRKVLLFSLQNPTATDWLQRAMIRRSKAHIQRSPLVIWSQFRMKSVKCMCIV